jgi:hypothetical protein
MKTKVFLPMIAMIFAIGMSFATESKVSDPDEDYIRVNGSFVSLGTEYDCGMGQEPCRIELRNGQIKDLYDAPSLGSQKEGNGTVVKQ